MEWLIFFLLCGSLITLHVFHRRLGEAEERLELVANARPWRSDVESLALRLTKLERARFVAEPPIPEKAPAPDPPPAPAPDAEVHESVVEAASEPQPAPEPVVMPITVMPTIALPVEEHTETPVAIPVPVQTMREPGLSDRIRGWLKSTEWESFVGGSLLNKIGALLLVIGIALFVSYSFGHVGALGRALGAIALSVVLLVTGVRTESRPHFAVFARGLIGAGWAAMYATAYAIYAVPATRIVANPFVGSVILFAVACGMIAHSLRYRAQALTAVTYFAAFAALAITPETPFAVLSMIPLAASLLYLAWRFEWLSMALSGIAATYLTCISRGDAHASLAASQSLMFAYWVLFEAFDLMRMRRRLVAGGVEWIFPANALGFLGLSYHAWSNHAPEQLWLASAWGAGLYLASAVVRFAIRPPSSFKDAEPFADRLRAGSFEGSALISAILAGLAIFGRVHGVWGSAALLVEAEIVYLAGVALSSGFLRGIGIGGFGISVLQAVASTAWPDSTMVFGHAVRDWSPAAVLHALVFYFNREVRRKGFVFSTLATALVAMVLAAEVPRDWAGLAWVLFGAVLLQMGLVRKLTEFRLQGLTLTTLGFLWAAFGALDGADRIPHGPWMPLAFCTALAYAIACAVGRMDPWLRLRQTNAPEYKIDARISAGAVATLAAILVWRVVPSNYVAMSWGLLMLVVLELGLRRWPERLRPYYLPMAGLCILRSVALQTATLHHLPAASVWLPYLVEFASFAACAVRLATVKREDERDAMCIPAVAAASILVWLLAPLPLVSLVWLAIAIGVLELSRRFAAPSLTWIAASEAALAYGRVMANDISGTGKIAAAPVAALTASVFIAGLYLLCARLRAMRRPQLAQVASWSAPILFVAIVMAQADEQNFALWCAGGMLALTTAGRIFEDSDFRRQSYFLSALTLAATGWFDLSPVALTISIPVVVAFYAARFAAARESEKRGPMYFSIAGTLLLAAVLYNAVSGHMLTVAWGIEGASLLCAGFILRDRVFRLQGLALSLACTLKLFLYDLRNLDTPYRIVSFIALGAILLGVSWVYTRFREQVRRIL